MNKIGKRHRKTDRETDSHREMETVDRQEKRERDRDKE